ncbi:fimbrial protein [Variovorax sp. Varisp41]|jgi:type 1 fimbria pilin|uniref:fimbrial protein n=1 Tax=unclassified Variovorax TaxID=663243 RepID=UPI000C46D882|nr:fimbrial protein [Variovorax sp.]MBS81748.1 fimbrial protein [Variovorax sp.]
MLKHPLSKLFAFVAVGALSQAAMASDGTINFQGEIIDATCSVAPSSQNKTVQLGKIVSRAFTGIGTISTPVDFSIDLLDCKTDTLKNAQVTFSGTADGDNLAIANSGQTVAAATGVSIQLKDSTGNPIKLGTPSPKYILGNGTNSLQFKANYFATKDSVTVGPANGMAQFTVAYN